MKKLIFVLFLLSALLTACSPASSPSPESYNSETALQNRDTLESQDTLENPDTLESRDALENRDAFDKGRARYAHQQDFYKNQIVNGETKITPELMLFFQNSSAIPPDIYLYRQYPSGYEFIKTVSGLRGEVEVTSELREKFNLFAQDYRWCHLPDLDGYESFFDKGNSYANALGYSNFADAVFYALSYLRFPQKVSEQTVQSTLAALFVAKDGVHRPMPHQTYRKIANYADGYYSPWPEGTPAYDRMFYLLTGLKVEEQESGEVYITVRAKQYYFEHPSYEPGEKEKWLAEKAKELGLADLEAAAKLIAENMMDGINGEKEYETTLVYLMKGTVPADYAPRIIFSRSRDLI